jgi:hypothetical protein
MKLNTFKANSPETFEFELSDYMPVRSIKQAEETFSNMSKWLSETAIAYGTLRVGDEKETVHYYVIEKNDVHRVRTTYGANVLKELKSMYEALYLMD